MLSCDKCDYQISSNKVMILHTRIFHDIMEKLKQKKKLTKLKNIAPDGIKHSCKQCNEDFKCKGSLVKHCRAVHEGVKYPCRQCNKEFTKGHYMKESNTLEDNAIIKQLQRDILFSTKGQCMKESNIHAHSVENS